MFRKKTTSIIRDERAAISPLYAVAILALVGLAGVGFDYGRLMALDTELQNAADQAALAAVTQLDGRADAMDRAQSAATNALATSTSAFVNETRISNRDDDGDGDARPITALTFRFFDGYANDTLGNVVVNDGTNGADAKAVEVTVNAREVFFALTPIIGALQSGDVIGRALATLESSVCNVPPMMFCVPNLPSGNADTGFPRITDIGKGLHLHMNANAADPWAPGNFGFLDIDYLTSPSGNPNHTLGYNESFQGCTGEAIESKTGVRDPEADALNSRFDFYTGSINDNACDGAGNICPAFSVRKNHTIELDVVVSLPTASPPPTAADCPSAETVSVPNNTPWDANPAVENFKKDTCFYDSQPCNVIGNGAWDSTTYFNTHNGYNTSYTIPTAATFGKATMADVTRYDVYLWEQQNASTHLKVETVSSTLTDTKVKGINTEYTFTNTCAYPRPIYNPPGISASGTQKDRRILTVAAVDCTGLNGKDVVNILRWVDLFLVQPADITGADKSFFTEIVGPAKQAGGGSGFQYFGKRKAVLIR